MCVAPSGSSWSEHTVATHVLQEPCGRVSSVKFVGRITLSWRDGQRGKVSWAPAKREETETRGDADNFLPHSHFFFTGTLLVRFEKAKETAHQLSRHCKLSRRIFFFFVELEIKLWVSVVDVKSRQRFNTEPEECIQIGQRRASVSGDVQPVLSGSPCFSKVSWTWAPLVSLKTFFPLTWI